MSKIDKTFDTMGDLFVAEQFLKSCHVKLAVFLRERYCKPLAEMSKACDLFMEAQRKKFESVPRNAWRFNYARRKRTRKEFVEIPRNKMLSLR